MFQKILYPTDFSDCSELALKYIIRLKTAGTEEVIVMHVLDIREITTIATGVIWFGEPETDYQHETEIMMKKKAETKLKKISSFLQNEGFRVSTVITTGIPSTEITSLARTKEVSLIIIGSQGKSHISGILMGSVSERVTREATTPVLIIKPGNVAEISSGESDFITQTNTNEAARRG